MMTSFQTATANRNPIFWIRTSVILAVLVLLSWYIWHQVSAVVEGPAIILETLPDNPYSVVHQAVVDVAGNAPRAQTLFINGVPVPLVNIDEFSKRIALAPGPNRIVITAIDRFDITTSRELEVYYDRTGTKRNAP